MQMEYYLKYGLAGGVGINWGRQGDLYKQINDKMRLKGMG